MAIYPVVLAGGKGTRLWPLSRANHPKQFLDLLQQGESLLQSTVNRSQCCTNKPPLIIASQDHRFLLKQQMVELGIEYKVMLEPVAKNTAASILLACFELLSQDSAASVLILPSDHFIPDSECFSKLVRTAQKQLVSDEIILLGIRPDRAATEYGYLKVTAGAGLVNVEQFIEKPPLDTAQEYLISESYYWNAGIVISKAQHIVNLFKSLQPDLFKVVERAYLNRTSLYDFCLVGDVLQSCESISFDYAILEQAPKIRALCYDGEWDDLGNWKTLLKRKSKLGLPQSYGSSHKAQVFLGVDDLVVVDEDDLLLVAHSDSLSDINLVTQKLIELDRLDLLKRLEVTRPWGSFKFLAQESNYIVKQLSIAPYAQISLQSHQYRSEHWVVVEGEGEVELNGEVTCLSQGQSISIGLNEHHRLSNNTKRLLKIIEVQTGERLDENDIVRYEDKYGRHVPKKNI